MMTWCDVSTGESRSITVDTYIYMAPEALWVVANGRGSFIGWQADMFSVGLTILQLLGGDLPLDDIHHTPGAASRILPAYQMYGNPEVRESL